MITALFFSLNAHAGFISHPANLSGTYDCNSTGIDSSEKYHGTMKIKKTDQTYSIESYFDDGSSYMGTGIYDQVKHSFAVVFANTQNPTVVSLGIADVKKNYSMITSWTFINKTSVGSSTCTKVTK